MTKYLLLFFLGHVLGDFYFQTDQMAKLKEKRYSGVLLHSFEYALTKYDDKWNKVINCSSLTVCGDSLLVTLLL